MTRRISPEVSTIYDDPESRFVVSLVVSYGRDADDVETLMREFGDGCDPMVAAAAAALDLTRDPDCMSTTWYVYDRKTREGKFLQQEDFDMAG